MTISEGMRLVAFGLAEVLAGPCFAVRFPSGVVVRWPDSDVAYE